VTGFKQLRSRSAGREALKSLDSASVLGVAVESKGGEPVKGPIRNLFCGSLNRSANSGCKVEAGKTVGILAAVVNVGWNAIG
jgi:hypothetical protein